MVNPCNDCLVVACCTRRCEAYAEYIFDTKGYQQAGTHVAEHIDAMSHDDAVEHILQVERVCHYLHLKGVDGSYKKVN